MHYNLIETAKSRQPFAALITTPCQVWCRRTLPYYSVFAAITLRCDLTSDPMTLTFDLWLWTFATYRLWRDKNLYQIWTQSNNPPRSYYDFSVWLYDIEHALSVALGSGIIFTKFDLTYPLLHYSFFDADTLCHVATLTFYPLTLKVRASRDQSIY